VLNPLGMFNRELLDWAAHKVPSQYDFDSVEVQPGKQLDLYVAGHENDSLGDVAKVSVSC